MDEGYWLDPITRANDDRLYDIAIRGLGLEKNQELFKALSKMSDKMSPRREGWSDGVDDDGQVLEESLALDGGKDGSVQWHLRSVGRSEKLRHFQSRWRKCNRHDV